MGEFYCDTVTAIAASSCNQLSHFSNRRQSSTSSAPTQTAHCFLIFLFLYDRSHSVCRNFLKQNKHQIRHTHTQTTISLNNCHFLSLSPPFPFRLPLLLPATDTHRLSRFELKKKSQCTHNSTQFRINFDTNISTRGVDSISHRICKTGTARALYDPKPEQQTGDKSSTPPRGRRTHGKICLRWPRSIKRDRGLNLTLMRA